MAYTVYGGVCLISPDPIGPRNERDQVWAAFRAFADTHGWTTAVMGAGERGSPSTAIRGCTTSTWATRPW